MIYAPRNIPAQVATVIALVAAVSACMVTGPGGVAIGRPALAIGFGLLYAVSIAFPIVLVRKGNGNSSFDLTETVLVSAVLVLAWGEVLLAIFIGSVIGYMIRSRAVSPRERIQLMFERVMQETLVARGTLLVFAAALPAAPSEELTTTIIVLLSGIVAALATSLAIASLMARIFELVYLKDFLRSFDLPPVLIATILALSFATLTALLRDFEPIVMLFLAVPIVSLIAVAHGQADNQVDRERLNTLLLAATEVQECESAAEVEEVLLAHGRALFGEAVFIQDSRPGDGIPAVLLDDGENARWLVIEDQQFASTAYNVRVLQGLGNVARSALRSVALLETTTHAAAHDVLTGLANRRAFTEELSKQLSRAGRSGEMVGLMFADLDGFKPVNDQHGHHVGDDLLKAVAQRLQGVVRGGDVVGRFGGDEFVIMLSGLHDLDDVDVAANKVLQELRRPFDLGGRTISIGGSLGIAMFPDNGTDLHDLMAQADAALYQAKRAGKNTYRLSKGRPAEAAAVPAEDAAAVPADD